MTIYDAIDFLYREMDLPKLNRLSDADVVLFNRLCGEWYLRSNKERRKRHLLQPPPKLAQFNNQLKQV